MKRKKRKPKYPNLKAAPPIYANPYQSSGHCIDTVSTTFKTESNHSSTLPFTDDVNTTPIQAETPSSKLSHSLPIQDMTISTPNGMQPPSSIDIIPPNAEIVQLRSLVNQYVKLNDHDGMFLVAKPKRKVPLTLLEELKMIDEMDVIVPLIETPKRRERKQALTPKTVVDYDVFFEPDVTAVLVPNLEIIKTEEIEVPLEIGVVPATVLPPKIQCARSLFSNVSWTTSSAPSPSKDVRPVQNTPTYYSDDSESSDDYYGIDSYKSLKCNACTKMFITSRSLVKHMKQCSHVSNCEEKSVRRLLKDSMTKSVQSETNDVIRMEDNSGAEQSKILAKEVVENRPAAATIVHSANIYCDQCDRKFSKLNGEYNLMV